MSLVEFSGLQPLLLRSILVSLLGLAGCTGSSGGNSDDDDDDGTGNPDAVTVIVGAGGAGTDVHVHDPAGAWISTTQTDDTGRAVLDDILDGSMVTVQQSTQDIRTIVGVQRGDELYFFGMLDEFESIGEIEIALGADPFVGAGVYEVWNAECRIVTSMDPGETTQLPVYDFCPGSEFTVFVVARDLESEPLAFQFAQAPLSDLLADGVTFAGPWREDWDIVEIDVTGVPAGSYGYSVSETATDASGRLTWLMSESAIASGPTSLSLLRMPIPSTEYAELSVGIRLGDDATGVVERGPPVTSAQIDVGSDLLPFMSGAAVTGTAGPLSVSWSGAPADADRGIIYLHWYSQQWRQWVLEIPPTATAPFVLPELPTSLESFDPPAAADLDAAGVTFEVDPAATWDDLRTEGAPPPAFERRSVTREAALPAR